ncbi:hypothetical protein BH11MYX4_BH11MYX4_54750 [soil metagenome]
MRILGPLALSLSLVVVACSGSSTTSSTTSAAIGQGITGACDGAVRCTAGATVTSTTLRHDASGEGCVVQGTTLLPGGGVEGSDEASWTEDSVSVRVCQADSCFTCERSDGTPAKGGETEASPKQKACKGYSSCPSSPPCSGVRGCYLHSHYHYDGRGNVSYVDYSCEGSASSCSEMSTEESCRSQGCRWE